MKQIVRNNDPEFYRDVEEVGREIALNAGRLIRKRFGSHISFETKAPFDYVTTVDREAEALIIEGIGSRFPDHNIVAEESGKHQIVPGVNWIVDPLDGTTNFIHGWPHVAVSVGVLVDGQEVVGLVYDPLREELFSARKGGGAYLNGVPIHIRSGMKLENALLATGFPFKNKGLLHEYLLAFSHIFKRVTGVRRAGSAALDLAYMAAGRIDGYWEFGLSAWDLAAGVLLVREAGGSISDFAGGDSYLSKGHIIAATPATYPLLLETARELLLPHLEGE